MATTIYSGVSSYAEWAFPTALGTDYSLVNIYKYPYPKLGTVRKSYLNKAWDQVAGAWVMWETNYPDPKGGYYPGPGVFGATTSDYHQEVVVHGREQL